MSEQNIELTGYPSIDKPWLKWYTYEEEGKVEQKKELTGYPSIDKPWLRYYDEKEINKAIYDGSMYDCIFDRNKNNTTDIAINYFGKKITYGIMFKKINECAKALASHGVRKGDIISLCMLAIPETIYLLYAINMIGAISNFIVLNATEEEINSQIHNSRLIFTMDFVYEKIEMATKNNNNECIITMSLAESMPLFMKNIVLLKGKKVKSVKWREFLDKVHVDYNLEVCHDNDQIATICYTGGTTGTSKGVAITNSQSNALLSNYDCASKTVLKPELEGTKWLDIVPPFLAYGLHPGIHMPLYFGKEVILCPDPDFKNLPKYIVKYKPNHLQCGPLHIDAMLADKRINRMKDLSFLKTVAYGGDKTSCEWEEKVEAFFEERKSFHSVWNGYGLTEMCATFACAWYEHKYLIPFAQNNVKIINTENGHELSYNQEGEICVSGPSLMLGYYNDIDATNEAVFEENGLKWFKTGDLGFVREDGGLVVSGRIKRLYWAMGKENAIYRIYPMRVEEVISQNTAVKHCCVVGKRNADKGYVLIAFISLYNDLNNIKENDVEKELRGACNSKFSAESRPVEYIFRDELPITGAGKVDYRNLEKCIMEEYDYGF